jgi:DNA (cytosine-5)-methyltransferase 1
MTAVAPIRNKTAPGPKPGTIQHFGIEPYTATLSSVDVFAGAGGLSLGLSWAGFAPMKAVEFDAAAADTYETNIGSHIAREANGKPQSIETVDFHNLAGQVDLLAGGPPCQGFSQLGNRLEDDPRNKLWREFMRAVDEIKPRAFLMENVPGILRAEEGAETVRHGEALGYSVIAGVLSAHEFGVPQKRRRAFILGIRNQQPAFPQKILGHRSVRWALQGIPLEPDGLDWHVGRNPTPESLQRYQVVPEGGNRFDLLRARPDITPPCWHKKKTGSTDVFGRLWWDKPALTIRTEFFKPEKGRYLHPSEHRPITHREAARLQTFPDDFCFHGSKLEVARQIGNAVPPVLAYHIGLAIADVLNGELPHGVAIQEQLFAAV